MKNKSLIGDAGRVMTAGIEVDFDFDRFSKHNLFNFLSRGSQYGFYYQPYGYFFRHVKHGTINELGFRCEYNFDQLPKKAHREIRIGLFGGSTAFDVLAQDSDALFHLLEYKLSRQLKAADGRRVRVINFGQPGNTVLNQIFNYILFGQIAELDIVVCHGPINDLSTVQLNDPSLVGNYAIGYPDVLEVWARMIHQDHETELDYDHADPNRSDFSPAKIKNTMETVTKVYIKRLLQFRSLVTGAGHQFMHCLQPWLLTLKHKTESEIDFEKKYNRYYQQAYANVSTGYEILRSAFSAEPERFGPWLDAYGFFNDEHCKDQRFGDIAHLIGAGNSRLAELYARQLSKLVQE